MGGDDTIIKDEAPSKKKTNFEIFSHDAAIFPLLLGFAHLLYGEESLLTMDGDALFGMRHHQQVS